MGVQRRVEVCAATRGRWTCCVALYRGGHPAKGERPHLAADTIAPELRHIAATVPAGRPATGSACGQDWPRAVLLGLEDTQLRWMSESAGVTTVGEPLADCLRIDLGRLDGKQVANVIDGSGCPARPSGVLQERRGIDDVIVCSP